AINQSPLKHPPTICSLISFFSNSERRQSICSPTQKHNLKDGETTTPCYISSPFGTFCRFINPGPAPDELLLQVLPQSRTDRARLRHQAHLQRPFLGRSSPQDALPRLLRQGVRCFCDDQLHGQQHGGESRRSQPDAPWVQLHRRPQDPAREGVPRSRLLRRYPRSRRQRLRRSHWRSKLASSHGKKRRQNLQLDGGTQRHPSADQQHHHAPDPLRQCRPRLQGPRPPLRYVYIRNISIYLRKNPSYREELIFFPRSSAADFFGRSWQRRTRSGYRTATRSRLGCTTSRAGATGRTRLWTASTRRS
ncbi:unnamed protein product, partial [Linum tenue]